MKNSSYNSPNPQSNRYPLRAEYALLALVGLCLALIALLPNRAAAASQEGGMSIGVVGAATIQSPTVENDGDDVDVDGKMGYGGGLTFEAGLRQGLGLEVDLLYLNHKFSYDEAGGVSNTVTSGYIHVPVLVRFRPISYVNLGAGVYYSRIIKSWNFSVDGLGDAGATYKDNDYGFVAALGTNIPVGDSASVVLDVRYARSLTDAARESNDALKFSDVQALAGVRFGF